MTEMAGKLVLMAVLLVAILMISREGLEQNGSLHLSLY